MKTTLRAILPALMLASGCSGFSPITDGEIRNLGLVQGIAGNTAMRTGDCMPGVIGRCHFESLPAKLWLVPESNAGAFTVSQDPRCRLTLAGVTPESVMAVVVDLESGRYGVNLPSGLHMPVVVEADGCGTCVQMNMHDPHPCSLVDVELAKVTKLDVVLNRAVE